MFNPQKYWDDRMEQWGTDPRGAGNKTLSVGENLAMFAGAVTSMIDNGIHEIFENAVVLEIGVGNGYFIPFYKAWGMQQYTGADITDKNFGEIHSKNDNLVLIKKNITEDLLQSDPVCDLIIMIDTEQHIVDDKDFKKAMKNIHDMLKPGGRILMTTWDTKTLEQTTDYEVKRPLDDILKYLPNYRLSAVFPYRDKFIFWAQKP